MQKTIISLLFLSLVLAGCQAKSPEEAALDGDAPLVNVKPSSRTYTPEQLKAARAEALVKCQAACEVVDVNSSEEVSPTCLSETIIEDWACFVVRYPREVGVQPGADCSSLQDGRAGHFVELATDCSVLRIN